MKKQTFQITNKILNQTAAAVEILTRIENLKLTGVDLKLRKINRVRSIQSSLAIEGNRLSEEMVSAIIDNKRVFGNKRDIHEAQNAKKAYELIPHFNPVNEASFLKGHKILMDGLIKDAGKYRSSDMTVKRQDEVTVHIAPLPALVPGLMKDLFEYLFKIKDVHPLIYSCVFHYELEFIHPFSDGNGRMGRLWQTVLLYQFNPVFEYVSIENMIKHRQQDYYDALQESEQKGEPTPFIEFMLGMIVESLQDFSRQAQPQRQNAAIRLQAARERLGNKEFSRKEFRAHFPSISTATASNDLLFGVNHSILSKSGEKRMTKYRFIV